MPPSTPLFPTHPLTRLPGPSPVHALTFSRGSGAYLLTGAQDRQIRLFNPRSGALIQAYKAHGQPVLDLAVAGDNARFASAGADKAVFVWDVASAATLRRFAGHAARVEAVAFGGEEDCVVVSGGFDGSVRVWDLRAKGDFRPVMVLGEARDGVSSVAVCGKEVFAGSVDGRVRVYDLAMGVVETDVVAPRAGVTCVCPTEGGEGYLVGSLDSRLRLMDRRSGACLMGFGDGDGEGGFRNVEFRVRSTLALGDAVVVSGSEDGRVFVWDVLTGEVLHRVWHKEGGGRDGEGGDKRDVVSVVAWNSLRKQWASAGGDGSVVVWGFEE